MSHKNLSLRVIPPVMNVETVGYNQEFYEALEEGKIVNFEPSYVTENRKEFYCRRAPKMRWHKSAPLFDLMVIRFCFPFRKTLELNITSKINMMYIFNLLNTHKLSIY